MYRQAVCVLMCAASAAGHGWVTEPASRAQLCSRAVGVNKNCGQVMYEPYSLEGKDGWPLNGGPADGDLGGGGTSANRFPELNEQSPTRWEKVNVRSGPTKFTWSFSTAHLTADYRYYMTKQDWNPSAPLGRDSFVLTPFCIIDGKRQTPPSTTSHECVVPPRTGYQVILAKWDVGDTSNSFYNVIDVMMDGSTAVPTPPGATPQPPAATPVPVSRCTGTELSEWSACLNSPNCCVSGTKCYKLNDYYAQCKKSGSGTVIGDIDAPAPTPATPSPPAATPTPPRPTPVPQAPTPVPQAPTPAPPAPTPVPQAPTPVPTSPPSTPTPGGDNAQCREQIAKCLSQCTARAMWVQACSP
eukprot:TRINITY_DN207_c0_g2_i1.p2 TRINITY_DN207_c0_g2~~TRINITY_DN207_c0_g2_i1.p2  ORF type:complete len:356 (+),score=108.32 TRINITY_DN207_c0_g2_i1:60-1127(+)